MINPTIWGPPGWKFIHYVCYSSPTNMTEVEKANYKAFLLSLQYVLPCEACRKHYATNLEKHSLDAALQNGKLFEWSVSMHNEVNRMNGKKELSVEEATEQLMSNESSKPVIVVEDRRYDWIKLIIILALVIAMFVAIYYYPTSGIRTRRT